MSTLNETDTLKLYDGGYYNICKQILSDSSTSNCRLLILSLLLGNAKKDIDYFECISKTKSNILYNLLCGAWNLSLCDSSVDSVLSTSSSNAEKSIEIGISILQKINNQHSNYLLFKHYIANQQGEIANSYLMTSAKLDCADAITTVNSIGLTVDDTDQCFDHCQVYCGTSDTQNICGCGPYKTGWIFGSCLICGCKTSLSCVDIAGYTSSGFIGLLQSVYQPLKLAACISSIVALGLQQSNSQYLSTAIFLSTSFTTLVTFINKDVQRPNDPT